MVERAEDIREERAELWQFLSDCASIGRKYKKLFIHVPRGMQ